MKSAIIIGGGLSGLITAIRLARRGIATMLFEKKAYPLHRVCGEYVSHEVTPFLKRENLFPEKYDLPQITEFVMSSVSGRSAKMPLDLGGFGISRFLFDKFLCQQAIACGVEVYINSEVLDCGFNGDQFHVKTSTNEFYADVVVGAYGKRSRLDSTFDRPFFKIRSPYLGVKYHIKSDHPSHQIALHNFNGGYCGVDTVENNVTNVCYLSLREPLKKFGDIRSFEQHVLHKNPLLKRLLTESQCLFEKPEVINEISFETKEPVYKHILMTGDAAGMIAPLCGNGMAMGIHAGKIASDVIIRFCEGEITRQQMEQIYSKEWRTLFAWRLWRGRLIQKLFGQPAMSDLAVNIVLRSKSIARALMRNTHGVPF